MMKQLLLLLIFLLFASSAFAQSTTVSGTVSDADSQTWNNGTISFTFSGDNPPYRWTGGTLNPNTPITAALSATGTYSVSVPDNNQIFPIGSRWKVTACPAVLPATSGCFISYQTITGTTQTLNLAPPAIRFSVPLVPTSIPPISAYADVEISGGWVGFSYSQLGATVTTRICQAVTGNTCTTWAAVGGSTPPGGSNTQIQFNNSGAFGASGNFTYNTASGLVTITSPGVGAGLKIVDGGSARQVFFAQSNANNTTSLVTLGDTGSTGSHVNEGSANSDFAGKLTCATSTVTKTFTLAFTSTPVVLVFDETTKGGANLTAISNTAFTVSCTGATDALDYIVIGNPN